MRQLNQDLPFRPSARYAFLFRLLWVIGLGLAIDVWTSSEASALTANPTTVTFQAVQGATNPPSPTVSVSKANSRRSSWAATDTATWLTVSPGAGSINRTEQVALAVNVAGLAAGTYTAMVAIAVDNGESASVPVTLKVAAAPTSPPPPPPPPPSGTTASLTWSPVTGTNLAGYKVYMGTASGRYGTPLDVGNVTSYTVSNLAAGTTYFFVVSSYSSSGSESPYSNEVSKSIY